MWSESSSHVRKAETHTQHKHMHTPTHNKAPSHTHTHSHTPGKCTVMYRLKGILRFPVTSYLFTFPKYYHYTGKYMLKCRRQNIISCLELDADPTSEIPRIWHGISLLGSIILHRADSSFLGSKLELEALGARETSASSNSRLAPTSDCPGNLLGLGLS